MLAQEVYLASHLLLTTIRMNRQINKLLFSGLSQTERRLRLQMFMIISLSILALSTIVVVGMHKLHHLPVRPLSWFN